MLLWTGFGCLPGLSFSPKEEPVPTVNQLLTYHILYYRIIIYNKIILSLLYNVDTVLLASRKRANKYMWQCSICHLLGFLKILRGRTVQRNPIPSFLSLGDRVSLFILIAFSPSLLDYTFTDFCLEQSGQEYQIRQSSYHNKIELSKEKLLTTVNSEVSYTREVFLLATFAYSCKKEMDMRDKDKFELEESSNNPINYHSPGGISLDRRFNSTGIPNSSLGLISTDNQMSVCRGDIVGAASCSSASVIDSFGPSMWEHPTNSQNLVFCDVNVQNIAGSSNTAGIGKGVPASLRNGIDRTLEMGWNPPNSMLKGGFFLPNASGMFPQSLSQFPADSAFIERAARFSCFNGENFNDMVNPFGAPESMGLFSRGGGMMQGTGENFMGSGMKSVSGGQAPKNFMKAVEASKDVSMSVNHMATEGSPLKNETKSDSLARSRDEAKQGMVGSGNASDEAEFSDGGGQDEPSMMEGNCREPSAKSLGSKKRKRNGQVATILLNCFLKCLSGGILIKDAEFDQAKGTPQSAEPAKGSPETQLKGDQKPNSTTSVDAGKQGKQGSLGSDQFKEEYIHVRARRGQATNSHSLAERVRREKISERMKFLQDLVPGCSKVTGKAVMLDEIINYVQSLQRQVEFLSMKLATVNPRLDLNIEGLLAKDVFSPKILQLHAVPPSSLAFSLEMPMAYPPSHPSQPGLIPTAFPGMDSHSDIIRRTINSQLVPMTAGFKEPAQQPPNVWDDELRNVVQMSYGTSAPHDSQDVNEPLPPGHLKAEL
ncbi:hypothetical protein SADUNF_Sadunf08G0091700 [Salix dunnii]|uniref:BHLH domain-containing protein n=1 Tax=Salix dunnii TaxID=1413687 RepID=A0A835JZK4_9ROSI|nr:hypothetical protein SADUNF_Sadunf08G0091700 [Salix dunnii]